MTLSSVPDRTGTVNLEIVDWRWIGRFTGAVLAIGAVVVLLLGVDVRGSGTRTGSCGTPWDVVAGRVGWEQWWAHDLADPLDPRGGQPVRTVLCTDAVNRRIVASGGLAVAALVAVTAGEVIHRRRRPADVRRPRSRLAVFGTVSKLVGGVLTVGGLIGIAILIADPHDALFLYVSRTAVFLAGLLLLLPALVLIAIGWLASELAARTDAEPPDAP